MKDLNWLEQHLYSVRVMECGITLHLSVSIVLVGELIYPAFLTSEMEFFCFIATKEMFYPFIK